MSTKQLFRIAGAVALATLLGACADNATAPVAANPGANVPALAVTGGPDLSDWKTFQGEIWICKDGNQTGTSFTFDWSVVKRSDGTPLLAGTTVVPLGGCVMAVHLPTEVAYPVHVAVTEQGPPADWALTALAYAYGANFPLTPDVPAIDMASRTISGVHASNDVGVQITFTNTYTPPPPPYCTYTQGFWKNHQELWDTNGEMVVWTGQTFFNSGMTYAEILTTPPKGGNSYLMLAHQYIAAVLNLNSLSDPVVDAYIAQAEANFAGVPSGFFVKDPAWNALASTLDGFNNGIIGPGHCDF